jgi:hypothetical protein
MCQFSDAVYAPNWPLFAAISGIIAKFVDN